MQLPLLSSVSTDRTAISLTGDDEAPAFHAQIQKSDISQFADQAPGGSFLDLDFSVIQLYQDSLFNPFSPSFGRQIYGLKKTPLWKMKIFKIFQEPVVIKMTSG